MSEDEFARRFYPLVYAMARRLRPLGDAYQDLAQVGIIEALNVYRKDAAARVALIACAAKRAMWHEIRRDECAKRDRNVTVPLTPEAIPPADPRPENRLVRSIDFRRAASETPAPEREVIARTWAGETLDEIARAKGVSLSRIAYLKASAVRRMQRRLAAAA